MKDYSKLEKAVKKYIESINAVIAKIKNGEPDFTIEMQQFMKSRTDTAILAESNKDNINVRAQEVAAFGMDIFRRYCALLDIISSGNALWNKDSVSLPCRRY